MWGSPRVTWRLGMRLTRPPTQILTQLLSPILTGPAVSPSSSGEGEWGVDTSRSWTRRGKVPHRAIGIGQARVSTHPYRAVGRKQNGENKKNEPDFPGDPKYVMRFNNICEHQAWVISNTKKTSLEGNCLVVTRHERVSYLFKKLVFMLHLKTLKLNANLQNSWTDYDKKLFSFFTFWNIMSRVFEYNRLLFDCFRFGFLIRYSMFAIRYSVFVFFEPKVRIWSLAAAQKGRGGVVAAEEDALDGECVRGRHTDWRQKGSQPWGKKLTREMKNSPLAPETWP